VYYYLIGSLKRRLINELRDSFSRHPIYRKIVPHIQNRYEFKSRPQFGIVIKGSSANKVQLSGDNYIGTVVSHAMLAYVGKAAHPIEWVREDSGRIKDVGHFPLAAGVYYVEILDAPTTAQGKGHFAVDPLLTEWDEAVLRFVSGIERHAQLQRVPAQGTLRLWENRSVLLREGKDYTVNYDNGAIELTYRSGPNSVLTADYRYAVPSIGPVEFAWNTADFTTLPGVIMAFGKRAEAGDKVAIVVTPDRVDTAQAFGGKYEVNFDFDIISRDPLQMEEMADLTLMYLWGEKKNRLEAEGIEIVDVSIGGEAEDTYDETADSVYFTASMSIQLRSDWEMHIPLPLTISQVTPTTPEQDAAASPCTPTEDQIREVFSDLFFQTSPIVVGRNADYERIT